MRYPKMRRYAVLAGLAGLLAGCDPLLWEMPGYGPQGLPSGDPYYYGTYPPAESYPYSGGGVTYGTPYPSPVWSYQPSYDWRLDRAEDRVRDAEERARQAEERARQAEERAARERNRPSPPAHSSPPHAPPAHSPPAYSPPAHSPPPHAPPAHSPPAYSPPAAVTPPAYSPPAYTPPAQPSPQAAPPPSDNCGGEPCKHFKPRI